MPFAKKLKSYIFSLAVILGGLILAITLTSDFLKPPISSDIIFDDTVSAFLGQEHGRYIVTVPKGARVEVDDAKALLEEYRGLPNFTDSDDRLLTPSLTSLDRSKVVVIDRKFYGTEDESDYRPSITTHYMCTVDTLECAPTSLLDKTRNLVPYSQDWDAASFVAWDSSKKLLVSKTAGPGLGNTFPVSFFSYDTGEVVRSHDSPISSPESSYAILPGAFSPSLKRFAVVQTLSRIKKNLLIYDKETIDSPTLSIDLDPIIEREQSNAYSVDTIAISHDHRKVALANERALWLLDLDSKEFEQVFRKSKRRLFGGSNTKELHPRVGLVFSDNDNYLLYVTRDHSEKDIERSQTSQKPARTLNAYELQTGESIEVLKEDVIFLRDLFI